MHRPGSALKRKQNVQNIVLKPHAVSTSHFHFLLHSFISILLLWKLMIVKKQQELKLPTLNDFLSKADYIGAITLLECERK